MDTKIIDITGFKALTTIRELDSFKEIESIGGEIFLVGGVVRDFFLNKDSKDIDIIIRLLDIETIKSVLTKFGKCTQEGANFPVLKFIPFEWKDEPIDIALPRKDRKADIDDLNIDKRDRGIVSICDPFLSIRDDLERRDCTINSIAISLLGSIIDPFCGISDMNNKILKATSIEAFVDDPLRILRIVQFASRFGFEIDSETKRMILLHKSKISTISKERIFEELNKIFNKGNIGLGIGLLKDLDLDHEILGFKIELNSSIIDRIKTIGDFFFCICSNSINDKIGDLFIEKFKGSRTIADEIDSIGSSMMCFDFTDIESRLLVVSMFKTSKTSLNSGILPDCIKKAISDMNVKKLPFCVNDLDISGNDLILKGFIGKDIATRKEFLLKEVLSEKRRNIFEELIKD